MVINKVITADWDEEEIETISSFREFLQDKKDEVKTYLPVLYKKLDDIDSMLWHLLVDNLDE